MAFIVFNWRPILLLLFSKADIEKKIAIIDSCYCYASSLTYPLLISLLYVLILPYLNLLIDFLLTFSNRQNEARIRKGITENLIQKKSEAKLEREIAEERAGTSEISTLKNQIERLNEENKQLSDQNKELFDRHTNSLEINKEKEKELQRKLEQAEMQVSNLNNNNIKTSSDIAVEIFRITQQLNSEQIKYFNDYCNFIIGKRSSIPSNDTFIKLYESLGLLNKTAVMSNKLTLLGKEFQSYLKQMGL